MAAITFDQVSKSYTSGETVIDRMDLKVSDGELLVLVGPSGCGKSTILRMLAGLDTISSGEIRIGERVINDVPPQQRNVAMVFQNYALYPHMSVRRNLEFPLRMQKLRRNEMSRRVEKTASMLDLVELLERRPKQLSGGQRQRVAMGRAIVRDANVFLMDEPLSNLDAKLRVQIRTEIARLQARLGITTLYVTHDQVEAMTLGQRVAVMHAGRLLQVASPRELYEQPVNAFVASFIGSPGMNLLHAQMQRKGNGIILGIGDSRLSIPSAVLARFNNLDAWINRELLVGIRPEAITLVGDEDSDSLPVQARITESLGHETIIHFNTDVSTISNEAHQLHSTSEMAQPLVAVLPGHQTIRPGDVVRIRINLNNLHFFAMSGEVIT